MIRSLCPALLLVPVVLQAQEVVAAPRPAPVEAADATLGDDIDNR